ncbi:MAG: hypothetical protein ACKV0T_21700 [Planctomycetales bacterium]
MPTVELLSEFGRREDSFGNQGSAQFDTMRQINTESRNRRTANRGAPNKHRTVPPEMLAPFLATWMKQPNDLSGLPITTGEVRAFMQIAGEAGQRQI